MNLKQYLKIEAIKAADFAKVVGANKATIYRIMNGEMLPSKKLADRIFAATNGRVRGDDFYGHGGVRK